MGHGGRGRVLVLCYHAIADLSSSPLLAEYGTPPAQFRAQVAFLAKHFTLIGADEFGRFLGGEAAPRRAVLITFDDCYRDLPETALGILKEFNAPALAFAVTQQIGGTNDWDAKAGAPVLPLASQEELHALAASGVTIGSHTRTHRRLDGIPVEELAGEIDGSLSDLERCGLGRPGFLAYPHGAFNDDVRAAAAAAGVRGAFTVQLGTVKPGDDPHALRRVSVLRSDVGRRFELKMIRNWMRR